MPKPSWSSAVKQRVSRFLEELLSYVLDYRSDLQVGYRWEDEYSDRPKLIVQAKRRFLEKLAKLEKQDHFYEIINRLKDLNLYEERRGVSLRGKDDWHFGLKLWSKDQQKNLREFDKEWEYKRPDKSRKLDNNISYSPSSIDNNLNIILNNRHDFYQQHFFIGKNINHNINYYLDLARLFQKNIGIFGNPSSGKSCLTRLLLSGILQKQSAVNLIFDLHSEYGWDNISRVQPFTILKGFRQIFADKVDIYTLDSPSKKRRGVHDAKELYLSYDQIEVEDIQLISPFLGISEDMLDNAQILSTQFGYSWINKLLMMTNDEIQTFCEQKRGDKNLLITLQHKLMRLDGMENARAVVPHNYISQILQSLVSGNHVVVEFGYKPNILCYQLIVNMVCRRINEFYTRQIEKSLNTKNPLDIPRPLVITIEDAHHLLNSHVVKHNIFNPLLRKSSQSYITLLAVERYPSKIDKELLSEFDTCITGFLNEEDRNAMLAGFVANQDLSSMLLQINSPQNMLFFGSSIIKPEVVQIRQYDNQFYTEIGYGN
ncbi:hypothetical protein NIES4103_69690 (plasmid) [Nostoc sp. NIES-4103]|nr:hypothetical protein NIES4103_69690 [Nostoc sp. NIES-4103]